MKLSFFPYNSSSNSRISLEDLQSLAKKHAGEIVARAEFSGCEGCYVEVCRWNADSNRYERFCFLKVFGGEVEGDWNDAEDTANLIAGMISPPTAEHPIFHRMPDWGSGTQG